MTATRNVLIAGCGRIGTRLGKILVERGDTVWGLRRRGEPLPAPLKSLRADLTRPATLSGRLPGGLELAYFIATPSGFDDEAYRATYVVGLTNLLDALREQPEPPRVVFVSSTAVYGQTSGEWVDETSPTEPNGFSGRRMREAENTLAASGLPGIAVRFGGIYGAGRNRMVSKVENGDLCVSSPPHYTNRVHEDDAVGILAHIGELRSPASVYLGVDNAPCTQCELMDWLADRMGVARPERTSGVPGGARGSNKRCRNTRLRETGYRFRYPTYRQGYEAILAAAPP